MASTRTSANGTEPGGERGTRTLPTIVSSRSVFGIIPATSSRNVAWSDDGQCLLVTRQGVTIATPYLTTTLPKPELIVDTSMQGGPQRVEDEEDEVAGGTGPGDEIDVDAEGSIGRRLARPRAGEIGWWMTGVGFDKARLREDEYGWSDIGDEFTGLVSDRDKERAVRCATWSPSGLSILGTPLLAVMTSTAQVSVFGPGDDLYTKQFVEVADLTRIAIDLLPEHEHMTVRGMNRTRATAMEWSAALPLSGVVGLDGSVLAIGNRAGGIDMWACTRTGRDLEFEHIAETDLPRPWASEILWSKWTAVSDTECTAQIAVATTDGGIYLLPVTRRAAVAEGTFSIELGELRPVLPPDDRVLTAMQWLEDDFLVWTKSGAVYFKHLSWPSPKMVRLRRVGNWAGCNALGACVGFQRKGTSLTVVLSTLTHHIINDITTEPVLAPALESLRATLAARDVFLDCTRRRRRGFYASNDKEYTAHTAGWAPLDTSGNIVSWMAEPITFHNLDSATEVNRISDFVIADLKTNPEGREPLLSELAATLAAPVNLLHHSPLGVLMPHLLRVIVAEEPLGQALCDLVSECPQPPLPDPEAVAADATNATWRSLMTGLWGPSAPNALRLRLVLAQWGQRTFPNLTIEFGTAIEAIERPLQRALARTALIWAAGVAGDTVGPLDAQYLGHLFDVCDSEPEPPLPETTHRLRALSSGEGGGACPACGGAVKFGGGSSVYCERGHEWERCSVTHLLITSPEYRLCTVCPAVSLLPSFDAADGGDGGAETLLVHTALEAAVVCPTCGGRWARAV